jgi:hypothetical protein
MATIACSLAQGAILNLPDNIAPVLPSNLPGGTAPLTQVNLTFGSNPNVNDSFWNIWSSQHADSTLITGKFLVKL